MEHIHRPPGFTMESKPWPDEDLPPSGKYKTLFIYPILLNPKQSHWHSVSCLYILCVSDGANSAVKISTVLALKVFAAT